MSVYYCMIGGCFTRKQFGYSFDSEAEAREAGLTAAVEHIKRNVDFDDLADYLAPFDIDPLDDVFDHSPEITRKTTELLDSHDEGMVEFALRVAGFKLDDFFKVVRRNARSVKEKPTTTHPPSDPHLPEGLESWNFLHPVRRVPSSMIWTD